MKYQYKIVKISVEDKEEDINTKLTELGKTDWELVNFQASTESHGMVNSPQPSTMFYILIFQRAL